MKQRFLPLAEVCEILSISANQAYSMVRSGELRAIKVGAGKQWRVEESELQAYITRKYAEAAHEAAAALEADRPATDLPG